MQIFNALFFSITFQVRAIIMKFIYLYKRHIGKTALLFFY